MSEVTLEINVSAYLENLRLLLSNSSCSSFTPVVKADAYGHGAVELAKRAEKEFDASTLPFFCVARYQEAKALRESGLQRPAAILSEDCFEKLSKDPVADLVLFLSTSADLEKCLCLSGEAKACILGVVIHLNTGMNRLGFECDKADDVSDLCSQLEMLKRSGLEVLGFASHLACGEENPSFLSQQQSDRFTAAIDQIEQFWIQKKMGSFPQLIMLSNSSGVGWKLSSRENCFRPGILSYGIFSDVETRTKMLREFSYLSGLKAIAQLRAPIRQIRSVKDGECVSYGHTYKCEGDKILAVLSYGYADGLRRSFSSENLGVNKASDSGLSFFILGEPCPIVGKVTMDMVLVDLSNHSQVDQLASAVNAGKIVWANWIAPEQTAEWHASSLGTISYEILCNVGARVSRVYKA